jgi:hypothetical protein
MVGFLGICISQGRENKIKKLEVYFDVHEVSGAQIIPFLCLKMEFHSLICWESDLVAPRLKSKPLVTDLDMFKDLINSNKVLINCPIIYDEEDKLSLS